MSQLFDKTTRSLGVALDHRLLRHNVTSANIANAETPGYKAQLVEFEKSLSRALETDEMRSSGGVPSQFTVENVAAEVYDNPDIPVHNDKNTVDMEREMSALAENTILYKAAIEMIKKKLGAMRYAVTEGGR